ncbi:uncharacterized protein HMPREF1541_02583 [Cyphellophora europaea CBS 101466]|uniref:Uncharacterized protein n=1 Tax=Cyphellophora europaea (strain CBS 101466) TaxID=1220924 RepID=W2S683_CYPE1|nr:uncharacterized protein HMPREF1541_02583 [Cyphellophora europaea CBS 101466]ETN43424.1 hypothetical protein HMPREF1541_02583 [Cyphellophora europaea CBS 101466]
MDGILYDTSYTAYAVPQATPALFALLSASPSRLSDHANTLREHLSADRAAYEDEEEREKIGGLRDCKFAPLQRHEAEPQGVAITLFYDKLSYKFVLYRGTPSPTKARSRRAGHKKDESLPLLLIKATSSLTARFLAYLSLHFHVPTIAPLKLPVGYLADVLDVYVDGLVDAHRPVASDYALLDFFRDTVGAMKLTISLTDAEIAKSLRTIDVDVPPETLYQLVVESEAGTSFLEALHKHLHARTGLLLPLAPTYPVRRSQDNDNLEQDKTEPPLKLSRIGNAAFALSSEGRLKFSSKSMQAVDAVPGIDSGEHNVVRKANQDLLDSLIREALSMADTD